MDDAVFLVQPPVTAPGQLRSGDFPKEDVGPRLLAQRPVTLPTRLKELELRSTLTVESEWIRLLGKYESTRDLFEFFKKSSPPIRIEVVSPVGHMTESTGANFFPPARDIYVNENYLKQYEMSAKAAGLRGEALTRHVAFKTLPVFVDILAHVEMNDDAKKKANLPVVPECLEVAYAGLERRARVLNEIVAKEEDRMNLGTGPDDLFNKRVMETFSKPFDERIKLMSNGADQVNWLFGFTHAEFVKAMDEAARAFEGRLMNLTILRKHAESATATAEEKQFVASTLAQDSPLYYERSLGAYTASEPYRKNAEAFQALQKYLQSRVANFKAAAEPDADKSESKP